MDNNFASIVSAVKWGRNVYAGIARFLQVPPTCSTLTCDSASCCARGVRSHVLLGPIHLCIALTLQFQLTINGAAIATAVGGALALQVMQPTYAAVNDGQVAQHSEVSVTLGVT
jgi:magnesium-transporting ATPase (P-type)